MSDIHGCYDEYIKMLELINFNDSDTLFIVGDICERGPSVIKILIHMMEHKNIIPIWGNHDFSTFEILSYICDYAPQMYKDNKYMFRSEMMDLYDFGRFASWAKQEENTLKDFASLPVTERDDLIEYFRTFKRYVELNLNGKDFILVHGGIQDPTTKLELMRLEDLFWYRPDYHKVYYEDKIIVSGHTPTLLIEKHEKPEIYIGCNNINIDCGAVFGYNLACLCLDNMQEYYVKSEKYY